jgi:hypothetical protein
MWASLRLGRAHGRRDLAAELAPRTARSASLVDPSRTPICRYTRACTPKERV